MYLYFNDSGTLMSTCSDDKAIFTIDGKEYSTSVEYEENKDDPEGIFQDDHGYKLKNGKIIDLGEVEQPKAPLED